MRLARYVPGEPHIVVVIDDLLDARVLLQLLARVKEVHVRGTHSCREPKQLLETTHPVLAVRAHELV